MTCNVPPFQSLGVDPALSPLAPSVTHMDLNFHRVANAILDNARIPSRLLEMTPNDSDPFYAFFSRPFPLPPKDQPLSKSLSDSVKAAWDEALPSKKFKGCLQRGIDAYHLFFQWLNAIRVDSRWTQSDTQNMMDRLEAIRDLLKRNVGNSCQPTQSPQTPAHHS